MNWVLWFILESVLFNLVFSCLFIISVLISTESRSCWVLFMIVCYFLLVYYVCSFEIGNMNLSWSICGPKMKNPNLQTPSSQPLQQLFSKDLSSSLISLVHLMALPNSFPISLQGPRNVQIDCYKQCVWLLFQVKYGQNVIFFVPVSYFLTTHYCLPRTRLMKLESLMLSWISKHHYTYVKLLTVYDD